MCADLIENHDEEHPVVSFPGMVEHIYEWKYVVTI